MAGRGPKYSREEDIALLRFEKHDGQKLRSREEKAKAILTSNLDYLMPLKDPGRSDGSMEARYKALGAMTAAKASKKDREYHQELSAEVVQGIETGGETLHLPESSVHTDAVDTPDGQLSPCPILEAGLAGEPRYGGLVSMLMEEEEEALAEPRGHQACSGSTQDHGLSTQRPSLQQKRARVDAAVNQGGLACASTGPAAMVDHQSLTPAGSSGMQHAQDLGYYQAYAQGGAPSTSTQAFKGTGVADLDPANTASSIVDGARHLIATQRQLSGQNSSLDQKLALLMQAVQDLSMDERVVTADQPRVKIAPVVRMNAEELTTASGSNPNPFKKPCDIIPKVWRQSGSLSRDEAIEKFGRENDQRWKAHQANVAKEVQRITGQTEQELKEEAASLACISREACTGRMEEFLNMVCPGALPSELQQSTRQSIRNAFQPAFGSHHKPHSLQTFTKYSKPHPLLHSIGEEQWELPSLGTQKEQKAERWTLARSFQIIGTDIELHVTAVPDIMWRNGIVRLKHDVHDSMDDKWREADETMVCITHILTEDDSQGRFDQGPDTVGVLAEYLLLKNAGSLVMECRDEAHVTAPAHQISAHQADDSTAGTMVITVFRKNQSHQVWEEKVMPGVKPFCQIIQRLLIDEAWQKGYLQAPDRAVWYEEAIQQL